MKWKTSFLQTEKLLSEQRRVSTICYNEKEEGFDYLSETSDDDSDIENDITWIAYNSHTSLRLFNRSKLLIKIKVK